MVILRAAGVVPGAGLVVAGADWVSTDMQFVFYRADLVGFENGRGKRGLRGVVLRRRSVFWRDCWGFDELFHVEQFGFNNLGDS
jgi:hypothetical protein